MPPLESLRTGLPSALVEVVRRALVPHRDERIPSARALADALTPFRAFPSRPPSDGGFADTVPSGPPLATSRSSGGPPSLPPGVPRTGRVLLPLVAVTAMAVAAATVLVVARHTPPAVTTATPPPAPATQTASASSSAAPTLLAETAAAAAPTPLPPPREPPARSAAEPRRPAPAPTPSATPSSSALSPSSAAHDLGLHVENPFR
jgi:serine/threonine-protein kinase